LVLHAQVEHPGIVDIDHALVEIRRRQAVRRLQPQIVGQEREIVSIARAQDDRIDRLAGAIPEMGGLALDPHQRRLFFPVDRPVEAHGCSTIAGGDRFRAVFPALRSDVLGRIAGTDDQHILSAEFSRVAKIMGMGDATVEIREAGIFWNVRAGEMSRGDDHMIESLLIDVVALHVVDGDGKVPGLIIIFDPAHHRIEADPVTHPSLFDPALDIVEHHGAGRVRGDLLAEMLFEGIVGELQPFLGPVGPQIAIHRTVHGFAMFVGAGAPSVVPEAAPVRLLLEADDLGNFRPFQESGLKGTQLGKPRRASANDGDSLGHVDFPVFRINLAVLLF